MEFLHIYLLLAAAIACLTAIAITKVIHKTTLLPGNTPTFIQDYLRKLERNLDRSRTGITVQQFFVLQIGCPAILAFLSALISTDRSLMLVLIILGAMLPNMFLLLQKSNEDKKFEDRFVRALTQMASSLHAGMTVEQAVDSVVDCELLHESITYMNFDQVILSMINDKMLQNNRISPELHQNIQRDILLMTTPVSSNTELTETVDNESDNCYTEKVM